MPKCPTVLIINWHKHPFQLCQQLAVKIATDKRRMTVVCEVLSIKTSLSPKTSNRVKTGILKAKDDEGQGGKIFRWSVRKSILLKRQGWGRTPGGPPAQAATPLILQRRTDLNQDNVLNKTYSYSRFNDNIMSTIGRGVLYLTVELYHTFTVSP